MAQTFANSIANNWVEDSTSDLAYYSLIDK